MKRLKGAQSQAIAISKMMNLAKKDLELTTGDQKEFLTPRPTIFLKIKMMTKTTTGLLLGEELVPVVVEEVGEILVGAVDALEEAGMAITMLEEALAEEVGEGTTVISLLMIREEILEERQLRVKILIHLKIKDRPARMTGLLSVISREL